VNVNETKVKIEEVEVPPLDQRSEELRNQRMQISLNSIQFQINEIQRQLSGEPHSTYPAKVPYS